MFLSSHNREQEDIKATEEAIKEKRDKEKEARRRFIQENRRAGKKKEPASRRRKDLKPKKKPSSNKRSKKFLAQTLGIQDFWDDRHPIRVLGVQLHATRTFPTPIRH